MIPCRPFLACVLAPLLASAPATAAETCRSMEPELIVPSEVEAVMAVIHHPETCSLVVAIFDASRPQGANTYDIDPDVSATSGRVSVQDRILRFERTARASGDAMMTLRLSQASGPAHQATLIVRTRD